MSDPRYPIGKFRFPESVSDAQRRQFIDDIAETPERLRVAVRGFSAQQFDTPYRQGGWTVRQVVHHVPDSHLNSYVRFKLALTEEEPTIKPYAEDRWANLDDSRTTPVEVSLTLLDSLHQRWVNLLRSMSDKDWKRTLRHPEIGVLTLDKLLSLYAWHGKHHVAHVTSLRERLDW
jgi:uncharacterized damage-inducible protein DinB